MAKRQSTSKPSPEAPTNPLAEAHKEIGAVINQLNGLQSFLKALAEADAHRGAVGINDLCSGFSNLLGATQASAERVHKLIREAEKESTQEGE